MDILLKKNTHVDFRLYFFKRINLLKVFLKIKLIFRRKVYTYRIIISKKF